MKITKTEMMVVIVLLIICFTAITFSTSEDELRKERDSYVKMYTDVVIRSGDTITSVYEEICKKYPDTKEGYNTKIFIDEVQSINEYSYPDINRIQSGDRLVVPYLDGKKE